MAKCSNVMAPVVQAHAPVFLSVIRIIWDYCHTVSYLPWLAIEINCTNHGYQTHAYQWRTEISVMGWQREDCLSLLHHRLQSFSRRQIPLVSTRSFRHYTVNGISFAMLSSCPSSRLRAKKFTPAICCTAHCISAHFPPLQHADWLLI